MAIDISFVCRGKFRSKPWQQLLDEARFLVQSGVKELNLIAEDTNQYGQDRKDGKGLAQLMHELGKLEGLQWMRILYAYPSYFTEDLIDEIATNPKVPLAVMHQMLAGTEPLLLCEKRFLSVAIAACRKSVCQ